MSSVQTTHLKSKFIPAPLGHSKNILLLVHGRTGNIRLLEWYSKRFQINNLAYLLLEAPYPDARNDENRPGFSWFLENKEGIDESRLRLKQTLSEIEDQGFKSEQLYWLGFSQGSVMGLDLALRLEKALGGFLCISGYCADVDSYPQEFGSAVREQKILITHGTRDEIITLERAQKDYDRLKELGVQFEFHIFNKPHSFHLREEVPFLEDRLRQWIGE